MGRLPRPIILKSFSNTTAVLLRIGIDHDTLPDPAIVYGLAALPPLREQGMQIASAYLITLVVDLFIGGILGKEPGWHGFASPRLQQRHGPVVASLDNRFLNFPLACSPILVYTLVRPIGLFFEGGL